MQIGYYPGCALHGSSNDYEQSVQACMKLLNVELVELKDWICCGATAAHSINKKLSIALPGRNLAIAERDGYRELLAPCPLCSMEFSKSLKMMQEDPKLRQEISDIVEMPLHGSTQIVNLVQVFQRVGLELLKAKVKRPLTEFKPACYYGCMLTRPRMITQFDDPEQPRSIEAIVTALGAQPVDWSYRTECCGAGMTMANDETVIRLSNKILDNARAHGANCIIVACPMCHVNLDMKQADIEREYHTKHEMMVYYLSDLVGLALGLDEKTLGIDRHFVYAPPAAEPAPEPAVTSTKE
jgi:heterodisulfide reductase subunit B2